MDVYDQVKHRLRAPTLAWKFDISQALYSDQHESFGYFGHCAQTKHINKTHIVFHLLFIICKPTDSVIHLILYQLE